MWNAKVRCVEANSKYFNLNNIYEVKNGIINDNEGIFCSTVYGNIDDLNNDVSSKFELVSEELPQPHKSLLKDGDYVVDGFGVEHIVSLKFEKQRIVVSIYVLSNSVNSPFLTDRP